MQKWPWNEVQCLFSEYPFPFLILDAIEFLFAFDENPKATIGASLPNSGFFSNYVCVCVSVYNFCSEIM